MARFSHPYILKLGKSDLVVKIRNTCYFDQHPPCPSNCSSSPFHITFVTQSTHRFLDPCRVSVSSSLDSSPIISECVKALDEKTICQDGSLFFKLQERNNSKAAVKTALRFLKVKKSQYGRIFKEVMAYGRRYNKDSNEKKKKKKKVFKGLVVSLNFVKSFIGDRDSVHEAMEKLWEETKPEALEDEDVLLLVN